ncbi:tetratricopeptide repeat protein [Asticcacaulis sp. BYS171W]|uniref:Tetratricopeptide repeat protein n=1 Tax=Asticcacaulis aquaticus TaxID=2984212 RepID=A0ABT5HR70_9CAUL|nr:tetratricopeptide repeat protein [Asticcacaulis aquaticus]MDC7682573.1 tetratricopeptide repeat protein [Asticcacaulis aquaticus]
MRRKPKSAALYLAIIVPLVLLIGAATVLFATGKTGPSGENEWITYIKARTGDASAQYYSGRAYDKRRGGVDNEAKAVAWYEKAAAGGHTEAQLALGDLYNARKGVADRDRALKLYEQAAAKSPEAQRKAALFYLTGRGSTKPDLDTAREGLLKAAERGDTAAEKQVGIMFFTGFEPALAKHWLEKAAAKNDGEALFYLGELHYLFSEQYRDLPRARDYYARAAETGNSQGQARLSFLYYAGRAVAKDPAEAYKWAWLAAQDKGGLGQRDGQDAVFYLERQLTPEQIAEGKRRAEAFRPQV